MTLDFHRLSIIDTTRRGHQPMCTRDRRYWIIFNGEVYNYSELREELEADGVTLRTVSDTEVLLETYVRRGADVVHSLRGMYAFAVWDAVGCRLFAARDPFGIKPLYYIYDDGVLRFASEKKALVDPCPPPGAVDHELLCQYLALQYVPGRTTLCADARELPPGTSLTARPGTPPELHRYWQPALRPRRRARLDTPRQLLAALRDSVDVHLRSDVPVGAFLSGGTDSAAICAIAAEHRPDLKTFTVGFEHEDYSEIDRAQATADALGITLIPYVITATEFQQELPRIVWHLDDPLGDAAAAALWFLAREARRHVKVVLSGEGADELFGGYAVYRQSALIRACERLPGGASAAIRWAAGLLPDAARWKASLLHATTPLERRYVSADSVFSDDDIGTVARQRGRSSVYEVAAPFHRQARAAGLDGLSTMQLVDLNLWLVNDILIKADRMTMAHGLELRVPFLDREVMSLASGLARREKISGGIAKRALRDAMKPLLPAPVVTREKWGFPVPMRHWLRDDLYGFAREVLQEADTAQHIDRRTALELVDRYHDGEDFDWRRIWVLVVFSLWHQVYVEKRYDPIALGWVAPEPTRETTPMP